MLRTSARVTDGSLRVEDLLAAVSDPTVGGIGMFVGLVRDHDPADPGSAVQWLEYSAHPTAEDTLAALVTEVAEAYDVIVARADHRVGRLRVGDVAVTVAVGAAHRAPALEACRELIDRIKSEVPIWKRQSFADGVTAWVGL